MAEGNTGRKEKADRSPQPSAASPCCRRNLPASQRDESTPHSRRTPREASWTRQRARENARRLGKPRYSEPLDNRVATNSKTTNVHLRSNLCPHPPRLGRGRVHVTCLPLQSSGVRFVHLRVSFSFLIFGDGTKRVTRHPPRPRTKLSLSALKSVRPWKFIPDTRTTTTTTTTTA